MTGPYAFHLHVVAWLAIFELGFEFDGRLFKSVSAAAKAITGSHCNGFLFFFGARRKGGER